MSDRLTIEAEPRALDGKKAKQLRHSGLIPGVIYGQSDTVHVQMENTALRRILRAVGTNNLVDVKVGGNAHTVLVREIQQHVTRGDLLHIDFLEVDLKSTIVTEASLIPVGQAAPEEDGLGTGVLALRSVEIEARADRLISEIEVDLSRIQTPDDVIYVGDLEVPSGVTILTDPETAVARFEYVQLVEEEEEEEEGLLEPDAGDIEIIGRGGDEDEAEEEA